MAFHPEMHKDHHVDMTETSSTIWHITIGDDQTIRAYDYSTGDGEGDYGLYCYDCMEGGPIPDAWELDFT